MREMPLPWQPMDAHERRHFATVIGRAGGSTLGWLTEPSACIRVYLRLSAVLVCSNYRGNPRVSPRGRE